MLTKMPGKTFLIDKYLHMDACGILRRIHKRIGEDSLLYLRMQPHLSCLIYAVRPRRRLKRRLLFGSSSHHLFTETAGPMGLLGSKARHVLTCSGLKSSCDSLGLLSTPLLDQCMEVTWEVMDSTASRIKRARTEYWQFPVFENTREGISHVFPLVHACFE